MNHPDWNLLRAFLETADTGSLSAAARKLGMTKSGVIDAELTVVGKAAPKKR